MQPKHLDYVNTQVLFIGEGLGELGKAVEQQDEDAKDKKETPAEELEKLEHEDEVRADNLKGQCLQRSPSHPPTFLGRHTDHQCR